MIPASRLALTTALFWFVAANLAELLLGLGVLPYTWRPAHAHMQLLGFVSLMIYGSPTTPCRVSAAWFSADPGLPSSRWA
jgi:drug/metabolite transporter superfamily protein YnfA